MAKLLGNRRVRLSDTTPLRSAIANWIGIYGKNYTTKIKNNI
ncbi:MAG: hypothetical protein SWX82_19240 [Cyanobacteriota bacterium]|nr:hypothetical protein [Cyanobacteriota bacterium]